MTTAPLRYAAVVLTGGAGSRLGGVDKATLVVGGRTLLDRALAAVEAAEEVVVVGSPTATRRTVRWTREDPPGGGPAAGVVAALSSLTTEADHVAVLAVDMPRVTSATMARLAAAADHAPAYDGAALVDPGGRLQPLCAVYRREALLQAATQVGDGAGVPMRRLVAGLRLVEVAARGDEARDVDTRTDLEALGNEAPEGG